MPSGWRRYGKVSGNQESNRWTAFDQTRSKLLEVQRKAIADLQASGYKDPEALFDEVWPNLKPTKNRANKHE